PEAVNSDAPVQLEGLIPRWLRQRLRSAWGGPEPQIEPLRAAILFADIAGFSGLTREFSSRGDAGLEQLTLAVTEYFGKLFDVVDTTGGDIENTYGDGFLAFWVADVAGINAAVRNAYACASQLVTSFDHYRVAPGFEFRLRAAVLEGDVFAIKVGGD